MKCLILVYFFAFIIVPFTISCHKVNNNEFVVDTSFTIGHTVGPKELYSDAQQEIAEVSKITGDHFATFQDIIKDAQRLNRAFAYTSYNDSYYPDSVRAFLKQERTFILDQQVKIFPILRKAYIDSLAKVALKDGVTITGSGTKIRQVGTLFKSEKEIHNVQNYIGLNLETLRFKGSTYRIHKDDVAFTYFPVHSKKDADLIH